MSSTELTGITAEEIPELREQHEGGKTHSRHGIEFETMFCLDKIGKQPDDYDGPQRYCTQRVSKYTPEEWAEKYDDEYDAYDERVYTPTCRYHFRDRGLHSEGRPENLLEPGLARITHGMYAEDWRLAEDFSEADAQMFNYVMSWADIYGWPEKEEDPARYDLLEQFAYDRVRSLRSEEYFEHVKEENEAEGNAGSSEIEYREVHDDDGVVVGEFPVPSTLTEDLRLLRKDLRDQMKELNLTPKSRGEMDALESQANVHDAVGEMVQEALSGDTEYDPEQFSDEADDDAT
ncbi:hypothetical protein [Halomonas sp.]|uniref:hypothetical protein n=1 Tax=Halomonas sp. TaxID=1486246 RepID=UPI003563D047